MLRRRIVAKQADIETYLRKVEPHSNRLIIVSIVAGGLAMLLTAGPAAGGPTFTTSITSALGTSPETAPGWRLLCAAAAICSFIATTTLSVYKARHFATRLAKSHEARARLESLASFLELTDLPLERATEQYTQIVAEVAFVPSWR